MLYRFLFLFFFRLLVTRFLLLFYRFSSGCRVARDFLFGFYFILWFWLLDFYISSRFQLLDTLQDPDPGGVFSRAGSEAAVASPVTPEGAAPPEAAASPEVAAPPEAAASKCNHQPSAASKCRRRAPPGLRSVRQEKRMSRAFHSVR